MKSKVAHVYGWTDKYIISLQWRVFLEYWRSIRILENEKILLEIRSCGFPHMEKSAREKMIRGIESEIKKSIDFSSIDGGEDEYKNLAALLARIINGEQW